MTPLGLTTIVDLAPRLALPFSLPAALWLETMGVLVVSALGVLRATRRRQPAARSRATSQARAARVIPLRRVAGGAAG